MMVDAASEVFGKQMKKGLIQVTIEPAEFQWLGYDGEMVSVCPSIPLAHCIGEWMGIEEAMKWREIILKVIAKLE